MKGDKLDVDVILDFVFEDSLRRDQLVSMHCLAVMHCLLPKLTSLNSR